MQWMYNSTWPKLIWQFWDYNLLPNGSFYGARNGARNLNLLYNYCDNSVYAVNLTAFEKLNLKADIKAGTLNSANFRP